MDKQPATLQRRDFLRGALATAILLPLGGTLASCVGGGGGATTTGGPVSADNPFGMAANSTVDAVIFKGGYGIEYTEFAGKLVEKQQAGSTVKVTAATNIAQTLQPRFVAGNPPDVIDNSGAGLIGINTIREQLADLTEVIEAKNYEGKVIKDTLYPGVVEPGTFDGKFVQLNYVLTVYAVWYSAALFEANGWTPPKTWAEALDLGAKAKAQGKYLFGWGTEAATYYLTMAIASAIKEGGDEVRLALENLEADCWSKPAVQDVLKGLKAIIDAGYVKPGGAGTQFTAAQAQWSNSEDFILYPSGGWIENEMKTQTKDGFKMTGAPEPTVSADSALPYSALHSTAGEGFIVPSQGKNVGGGKEFLRAMLSNDAAVNFAKTTFSSTIVKDTIPEDGFGSTALVSQVKMLNDAGTDVFSWSFIDLYGLNTDLLVLWNTFLQGGSDVATLTKGMQDISDKVRNDDSVDKVTVK
ncbi:N-acetylglucosamine/diacetylchitobiose ABC transporter substrate-binding protein [Plantibacter flavus]|uniref:N-acetylglucosamine/diacetylchitobiose ABC transporter substrate-binding protein n=1 Tax=Plantibacter flavus TaxID=150123 RepID=UPI0023783BB2|nr:N-acetylglucosamine/diacetylchitobiose ABC transporter substrate-binding protein [Plantibacter flavus]MDD9152631.1 N-acetylglucosamine/diacetylchitobiose ABC transporter substrate-binding protein [Plantibacter flavus]